MSSDCQRHPATKRGEVIHFNGSVATSSDMRDSDRWRGPMWGRWHGRVLQLDKLYANDARLSGATTNTAAELTPGVSCLLLQGLFIIVTITTKDKERNAF